MKHYAALALLAAISATASAQSSVTLFGVADLGIRHVKNGDNSVNSLSSQGANTSRIGVRGMEDLGGGLQAGFWLEAGLNPDTGTQSDASRLWNRRSTLSLIGGFGELRLGRDKTPTYTVIDDFDAFGTNGVAAGDKFLSKLGTVVDTNVRADNLAQYFLPSGLGGVYGSAAVAAGEGTQGKKYAGGRIGYATGPVNVSLAYGQTDVGPNPSGGDKYKTFIAGASYDFGMVKLLGAFDQMKAGDLKLQVANIGALIPVGRGKVRVSYIDANAKGPGIDANDATQVAVGYLYDLSKRTSLYGTVARVNNKGRAAFVVDANPALPSPNPSQDSTGYEIGIRHSF
jgi:predicted porin